MPNKTDGMNDAIKSQVATLLLKGSEAGSLTEEDVRGALKDVDMTDAQLTAVYGVLRDQGIAVLSGDEDDVALDVDDVDSEDDLDRDELDD